MWLRFNYLEVFESNKNQDALYPTLVPYGCGRLFIKVNRKDYVDNIISSVICRELANERIIYSITKYNNALSASICDYIPSFINLNKKIDNVYALYNKYCGRAGFILSCND